MCLPRRRRFPLDLIFVVAVVVVAVAVALFIGGLIRLFVCGVADVTCETFN